MNLNDVILTNVDPINHLNVSASKPFKRHNEMKALASILKLAENTPEIVVWNRLHDIIDGNRSMAETNEFLTAFDSLPSGIQISFRQKTTEKGMPDSIDVLLRMVRKIVSGPRIDPVVRTMREAMIAPNLAKDVLDWLDKCEKKLTRECRSDWIRSDGKGSSYETS